mgnify:CR=1 FL=1
MKQKLTRSSSDKFIAGVCGGLARSFGYNVIAEGVETIAQKQLLESLFIDAIQGYLIARPSPLSQAITGLPEGSSLPL